MCGIVGIMGVEPVNVRLYDALTVLQHRGQDAAGIATDDAGLLQLRKENGLVRDVALRDPVLEGALVRRIEHELSVIVGRRGLDDQARLHAGALLR